MLCTVRREKRKKDKRFARAHTLCGQKPSTTRRISQRFAVKNQPSVVAEPLITKKSQRTEKIRSLGRYVDTAVPPKLTESPLFTHDHALRLLYGSESPSIATDAALKAGAFVRPREPIPLRVPRRNPTACDSLCRSCRGVLSSLIGLKNIFYIISYFLSAVKRYNAKNRKTCRKFSGKFLLDDFHLTATHHLQGGFVVWFARARAKACFYAYANVGIGRL